MRAAGVDAENVAAMDHRLQPAFDRRRSLTVWTSAALVQVRLLIPVVVKVSSMRYLRSTAMVRLAKLSRSAITVTK
jgi:hypothetical protein